jgi:hypothetical protein
MSEFNFTVGACYDERRKAICASHLQKLGFHGGEIGQALQIRKPVKEFLLLNVATICVFHDYVAGLVGKSTSELMKDEAFANLAFWDDSLWAPIDFTPTNAFEDDPDGPFFFGSSPRLLATLNHIKSISKIPLGPVPKEYELMVADLKTFYRSFNGLNDDQSGIQWVWRGLHDATTLAVQNKLPMLGNGL